MNSNDYCPQCGQENMYPDNGHMLCADCGFEVSNELMADDEVRVTKDAHGTVLNDGDSVILTKDLKVKGSSIVIKKGTKVKSIRLVDGDHDVDCKIDGVALSLKSMFLKKV